MLKSKPNDGRMRNETANTRSLYKEDTQCTETNTVNVRERAKREQKKNKKNYDEIIFWGESQNLNW